MLNEEIHKLEGKTTPTFALPKKAFKLTPSIHKLHVMGQNQSFSLYPKHDPQVLTHDMILTLKQLGNIIFQI